MTVNQLNKLSKLLVGDMKRYEAISRGVRFLLEYGVHLPVVGDCSGKGNV